MVVTIIQVREKVIGHSDDIVHLFLSECVIKADHPGPSPSVTHTLFHTDTQSTCQKDRHLNRLFIGPPKFVATYSH